MNFSEPGISGLLHWTLYFLTALWESMTISCGSALTGQTRSQTIYVATRLLHSGYLTFLFFFFFSVSLTPASSVGSLGAFQSSKAPLYCFRTLKFTDVFFWRQRGWKGKDGSESQQKQNSTKCLTCLSRTCCCAVRKPTTLI